MQVHNMCTLHFLAVPEFGGHCLYILVIRDPGRDVYIGASLLYEYGGFDQDKDIVCFQHEQQKSS